MENIKENNELKEKINKWNVNQEFKIKMYKPVSIGSKGCAEMLEFTLHELCERLRLLAWSGPWRNDWDLPKRTTFIFFCFKLNGWNEFLEKIMKNNEFPSLSIDLVHTKPFVFWKYSRIPCWIIISRKAQLIHEKTNNHLKKYSKREKKTHRV